MKTMGKFLIVIVIGALLFYALVGALYLNGITHHDTTTTTCDSIERIDGTLYCMAVMHGEDDNITVTRTEAN